MNASIPIGRLLALLPFVALAAACSGSGVSPASSTNVSTAVSATDSGGDATAMAESGTPFEPSNNRACRLINAVFVRELAGPTQMRVSFEAQYRYTQSVPIPCTVHPKWVATRGGLHVADDGFHAAIQRKAGLRTTVTVTAPNGIDKSVTF